MKKFETVGVVTITDGLIELSVDQVSRRNASLNRKGKSNQYEILMPIQFKSGEEIGLKACPKGMENMLTEIKAAKDK